MKFLKSIEFASTTLNTNLNADLLDGLHASDFLTKSGGTMTGGINMGNFDISNINNLTIGDPGPNEGIYWAGGSLWRIYESPNDLTTNTGGNLQIVKNGVRIATFNTTGQIEIPLANGTSPFLVSSSTLVEHLNADLLDGLDSTAFATATHSHSASDITSGQLSVARGGTGAFDVTGAQQSLNVYDKSTTYQRTEVQSLIDYSTWSSGWTSFNSTLTNVTIGTAGTKEMFYMKIGKIVHVKARFILGTSGFSVSGTPTFTLPTSYLPLSTSFSPVSSICIMRLASVSYVGYVGFNGTNAIQVVPINAASTYASFGSTVSSTIPATWAAGDSASLYWSYETA